MKKINIVLVLKYFILFTAISILFDNSFSFGALSFFMIFFIFISIDTDRENKNVYYSYWIKGSGLLVFSFWVLQLIPLPYLLLEKLSGTSSELLILVSDSVSKFHSISIIPFETFFFGIEICILFLFGYRLFVMKLKKNDIVSFIEVIIFSLSLKIFLSLALFFNKYNGNFKNYLLYEQELRISLLLIIPLVLGLIFYKIEFLRKSVSISERLKLFTNNSRYWFIYVFILITSILILIIRRGKFDVFISSFSIISFFSIVFYLKQLRRKRRFLKPILFVLLTMLLAIGLLKINRPHNKDNNYEVLQNNPAAGLSLAGTGFGTVKFITPILSYIGEKNHKKIIASTKLFIEGGVIGVLSFGLFLFFLILSLVKMWRSRKHPDIKMLVIGLFCTLGCSVILGLYDSLYHLRYHRFIIIVLLAITFKLLLYKRDFFNEK